MPNRGRNRTVRACLPQRQEACGAPWRRKRSILSARSSEVIWHSQIVSTRHPRRSSARHASASRSTFLASFGSQYVLFDAGRL